MKCFVCNSGNDTACADTFSQESQGLRELFFKECPEKPELGSTFCRKTKMWFDVTGESRVHRDCGYLRRVEYDCYQTRADDHVVDICQCDEEGCNGAPGGPTSAIATAVMSLVAALAARN